MLVLLILSFIAVSIADEEKKINPYMEFEIAREKFFQKRENFTSCEEFLNNTDLDLSTVKDVDWKVFYAWHYEKERSYQVRFSEPTKTLVYRFKMELDDEIYPKVNWTAAEFFMESSIDFSGLYIRQNTSGLYRVVPSLTFRAAMPASDPMVFAMKIVEPGYLGVMNCRYRFAAALSPIEIMPTEEMAEAEAAKLNFRSDEGYVAVDHLKQLPAPNYNETDDREDEEEMEIDEETKALYLF